MEKKEISCDIKESYGAFGSSGTWEKVNLISWAGKEPKIDIRNWGPNHTQIGKGMTMTIEEARMLGEILIRL